MKSAPARLFLGHGTRQPLGRRGSDAALRDWLTHADSLTARIRARSTRFSLRVVYQGHDRLLPVERRCLPGARFCHAREVLLLADGVPVVWARTVLPEASLRGAWRFLGRLGTRPLGERLFSDPRIRRSRFGFVPVLRIGPQSRAALAAGADALAARCALLVRKGQAALLTEALLPAIRSLQRRR